jgi:site-specific DNA-methyltransferase (adenine-specific)
MVPYYEHAGVTIYHGDCRDVMPLLACGVDLVLTDPPYRHEHADGGGIVARSPIHRLPKFREMSACEPSTFVPQCLSLQAVANFVAFGSRDLIQEYARLAEGRKFDLHVLWKPNAVPFCNNTFKSDLEYVCLIYEPGRPFQNDLGEATYSKVFQHWLGSTKDRLHPTIKPLPMISRYVAILSKPHGLILDPFMGSGTTLSAAKYLGRNAIGIEFEEQYCEIAATRLQQEVLPLEVS